jgi:hypothetical protein
LRPTELETGMYTCSSLHLFHPHLKPSPSAPPIDIVNNIDGINWSIVAEKVSDSSPVKRTPDECRIQWVGNLHPKVNHGDWTQDELNKLHHLIANALASGEKPNWARVAKELGVRPRSCPEG